MAEDRNCLSFWFPRLQEAGLPVPETRIVRARGDLADLLDGKLPEGWPEFIRELRDKALVIGGGWPVFLRTGHGSGKHDWSETCFVQEVDDLPRHVARLVEWSHSVDLMGLPHEVWAVRQLLDTFPLFSAFKHMPITREFRVFIRGGGVLRGTLVDHVQPYWPPDSIIAPDVEDWEARLAGASALGVKERVEICSLAQRAVFAVGGGYWSVDLLQTRDGSWYITDMADGDRSFRWEP